MCTTPLDFRQANKYTFESDTGVLKDALGDELIENEIGWAYYGPFFEDTASNRERLLCSWDENSVCDWSVWSLDESFYYYTGYYQNRVTMVKGDGSTLKFSDPIDLVYTHQGDASTSNDGADYAGTKTVLHYEGPGALTGLPVYCLDPDTKEVCFDRDPSFLPFFLPFLPFFLPSFLPSSLFFLLSFLLFFFPSFLSSFLPSSFPSKLSFLSSFLPSSFPSSLSFLPFFLSSFLPSFSSFLPFFSL